MTLLVMRPELSMVNTYHFRGTYFLHHQCIMKTADSSETFVILILLTYILAHKYLCCEPEICSQSPFSG
jgi:hypothetical protein